jgi:putative heme iron utilization protein
MANGIIPYFLNVQVNNGQPLSGHDGLHNIQNLRLVRSIFLVGKMHAITRFISYIAHNGIEKLKIALILAYISHARENIFQLKSAAP